MRIPTLVLMILGVFPFGTAADRDFSRHSIPLDEIHSGGPPKDGIPALTDPKHVPTAKPGDFLLY
jgi:hypothetical protein